MRTRSRYCNFIFGVIWLPTLNAENITTATKPHLPSVRPTRLLKIINVQMDEQIPSTVDIFRNKPVIVRRKSHTDIWAWDFWCQLQPRIGNCHDNFTKYYYDAQLDQCLRFFYTGCGKNKNQFETKVDCERHCKGAVNMPAQDNEEDLTCSLQPHAGFCLGYTTMYYYNINSGRCQQFGYGGCGGNDNRFATEGLCMEKCEGADENSTFAQLGGTQRNSDDSSSSADDNNSDGIWSALYSRIGNMF